jgi:chromosome segregation ATPase
MPTPFDDLRCIDCGHLWSEHNCIPGDSGLHFVMDNETAEDLRRYLVALAEKVESLRTELKTTQSNLDSVKEDRRQIQTTLDNLRYRIERRDIYQRDIF